MCLCVFGPAAPSGAAMQPTLLPALQLLLSQLAKLIVLQMLCAEPWRLWRAAAGAAAAEIAAAGCLLPAAAAAMPAADSSTCWCRPPLLLLPAAPWLLKLR